MTNDIIEQLPPQVDLDTYHRRHAFTLPSPGDKIISPITGTCYMIDAKFAQGSFGDVFACTDEWDHDLVAKIIRPVGDDFVQTEAKAFAEISALALVRSPYIVHVHDAILYRGACYIISERCHRSLRQMIAERQGKLHFWFPALTKAILHALHFVHVQDWHTATSMRATSFSDSFRTHFFPKTILRRRSSWATSG